MPRRFFLVALLVVVAASLLLSSRAQRSARDRVVPPGAVVPTAGESQSTPAGRAATLPDESWIDAAAKIMDGAHERDACGPYRLLTDLSDGRFARMCASLALTAEIAYEERFGVALVGEPRGAVLAFSQRGHFRRFVGSRTALPIGYAAFTRPSRGIVALTVPADPEVVASTLGHELGHLLHRRAFGPGVPPWLSEGLADALGDSATADGFPPLARSRAAGSLATRLLAGLEAGESRSVEELLSIDRGVFDRAVRSFDYEHSALLTRFLLLDPELSESFRAFLGRLAAGDRYAASGLLDALDVSAASLEERFALWLRSPSPDELPE